MKSGFPLCKTGLMTLLISRSCERLKRWYCLAPCRAQEPSTNAGHYYLEMYKSIVPIVPSVESCKINYSGTSALVVNWFWEAWQMPNKWWAPGQNVHVKMCQVPNSMCFQAVKCQGLTGRLPFTLDLPNPSSLRRKGARAGSVWVSFPAERHRQVTATLGSCTPCPECCAQPDPSGTSSLCLGMKKTKNTKSPDVIATHPFSQKPLRSKKSSLCSS